MPRVRGGDGGGTRGGRVSPQRQRQNQKATVNSPWLDPQDHDPITFETWPEIVSEHPDWYQVHRIEQHDGISSLVLIAERQTSEAALVVVCRQAWRCRITHRGSVVMSYLPMRPVRRVTGG